MDKERRLRELHRHTDRTPSTYWGAEEFVSASPGPETRWWVRSLDQSAAERYRYPQGPWNPADVVAFLAKLDAEARDDAFVIQQYILPAAAGATLCTPSGSLSEGVAGAAAPLLRGGTLGDAIASHDGRRSWLLDRAAMPNADMLERAHESIPRVVNTIWEWIVDKSGQVYHVDRKDLQVPFLEAVPAGAPPTRWSLGRARRGATLDLPDTSIAHLDALPENGTIRVRSGSPLSHLCLEAVLRGNSIELGWATNA